MSTSKLEASTNTATVSLACTFANFFTSFWATSPSNGARSTVSWRALAISLYDARATPSSARRLSSSAAEMLSDS